MSGYSEGVNDKDPKSARISLNLHKDHASPDKRTVSNRFSVDQTVDNG